MTTQENKRNQHLARREFDALFVRQGFDRVRGAALTVRIGLGAQDADYAVAVPFEKRGFVVGICQDQRALGLSRAQMGKLTANFRRLFHENILIFCGKDAQGNELQKWNVTIRPQNRPQEIVQVEWRENVSTQLLQEKLQELIFPLQEEAHLTIVDVVFRVREAFSQGSEGVTRGFYGKYKTELDAFSAAIKGTARAACRQQYAALMLNRLMFIWFIQKKNFLDNKPNYLPERLAAVKQQYGPDRFHDKFYRDFLRRLFADGLNTPPAQRAAATNRLLGRVPYLNGGLFEAHRLETDNPDIRIPDSAFERLFGFLGKYQWRMDERPARHNRADGKEEINPDILGHIFEKFINNRADMGAYYTQEDITDYIAKNTLLPALLRRARAKCESAFVAGEHGIWDLLRQDPDRYIYDSARHGMRHPDSEIPPHIARGLADDQPNLAKRRAHWNSAAPAEFALPGETWRECIARRQRCRRLRDQLQAGNIADIAQLTAHNLNIRQFVTDAIAHHGSSDFVHAVFTTIAGARDAWTDGTNQKTARGLAALDPACGSGAFLFAALNILKEVYAECITQMQDMVEQDDARLQKNGGRRRHLLFRRVLAEIADHPNRDYWICKTIILENLFGVDIMPEAAEIAKLRLFLKLAAVAQYDPAQDNLGLEPLPDIDHNIRSGNALVGFASMARFNDAVGEALDLEGEMTADIRNHAEKVKLAAIGFRNAQVCGDGSHMLHKGKLGEELAALNDKLNAKLAKASYDLSPDKAKKYGEWLATHQPFHWLAEFYDIMETHGGFDVIIGNPPYVEYRKVKKQYAVFDYAAGDNTNIYAFFIERADALLKQDGYAGMIVPISLPSTPRMQPVRDLLQNNSQALYIGNFADRPSTLFTGVHQKTTIFIQQKGGQLSSAHTTVFHRWNHNSRQFLFDTLDYVCPPSDAMHSEWKKFGTAIETEIWQKIATQKTRLSDLLEKTDAGEGRVFINKRLMHWVKCSLLPQKSNEFRGYRVRPPFTAPQIMALLNSSLFFWLWETLGDGWDLTKRELNAFMVNADALAADRGTLAQLGEELNTDLENKKVYVGTVQTDYEYKHKLSKPLIDKIDAVLARHYDLTDQQLDFIANYTIKYRMGGAVA